MCGRAYLIPKKVPPSNRAIDSLKPSTEVPAIGPPSPPTPALFARQSSLPNRLACRTNALSRYANIAPASALAIEFH
jgi:hypothetical protein